MLNPFKKGKVGTVVVAPAPPTMEKAQADLDAAARDLTEARVAVARAVDAWPRPNNVRALIEEQRPLMERIMPRTNALSTDREAVLVARFTAFDLAVRAETEAMARLEAAGQNFAHAQRIKLGDGRADLASAIRTAAERQVVADAARATLARVKGSVQSAEAAVADAEAAVAGAQEVHTASLLAGTEGASVEASASRRAARLLAIDAADDLEAAQRALSSAEAAARAAQDDQAQTGRAIDAAARAVLAEAAVEMVEEVNERVADFKARNLSRLAFIKAALSMAGTNSGEDAARRAHVEALENNLILVGPRADLRERGILYGADIYDETLDALRRDATAPIPDMP